MRAGLQWAATFPRPVRLTSTPDEFRDDACATELDADHKERRPEQPRSVSVARWWVAEFLFTGEVTLRKSNFGSSQKKHSRSPILALVALELDGSGSGR